MMACWEKDHFSFWMENLMKAHPTVYSRTFRLKSRQLSTCMKPETSQTNMLFRAICFHTPLRAILSEAFLDFASWIFMWLGQHNHALDAAVNTQGVKAVLSQWCSLIWAIIWLLSLHLNHWQHEHTATPTLLVLHSSASKKINNSTNRYDFSPAHISLVLFRFGDVSTNMYTVEVSCSQY